MSKDDEAIMSNFTDLITSRASLLTCYEMDSEQVSAFIERVISVERNVPSNAFPDFVGELMDVEVFNISSSKETGKGSLFFKEKCAFDKRKSEVLMRSVDSEDNKKGKSFVGTLEYTDHSYEFYISSLQRNIKNHKESLIKNNLNGKKCTFIANYTQTVLSYVDENGVEQWYKLGVDSRALRIILNELKGLVDYFILFNPTNSEAELIPINMISSYLDKHTFNYEFYPRKNAGMICIAVSEQL